MKYYFSLLLIGCIFSSGCNFESSNSGDDKIMPENQISTSEQKFGWLTGNWIATLGEGGELHESWNRNSDDTYNGTGYFIVDGDTVMRELLRLDKYGKHWGYVANINNSYPVLFSLVSEENDDFVFENPEHDFPQRIIYSRSGADTILARVEGEMDGEMVKDEYQLVRVQ